MSTKSKVAWRDRPKRIAQPCAGCGVVIIGTSLRVFDEARAEHYDDAHGIKRPCCETCGHSAGEHSVERGVCVACSFPCPPRG